MMSLSRTLLSFVGASTLLMAACTEQVEPNVSEPAQTASDALELTINADSVSGVFHYRNHDVRFETAVVEGSIETTLELRQMVLLLTGDQETGVFDTDGFVAESGKGTAMTIADRAMVAALGKAFDSYNAQLGATNDAVKFLSRSINLFGEYPATVPLERIYYGRFDRSSDLCGSVNKPGQGAATKMWVSATHDCWETNGDCSDWWGCDRGDDNSTTNNVFMSMHPDGTCSDGTFFGEGSTSFVCYEPNHPGATEYAYGGCFGRCGGGCGSDTQFTQDCLDHDQCVRLGHGIADLGCDDEFTGAGWDYLWASSCAGTTFRVDYNWGAATCPTTWNGTNDGCDIGCQFIDGDCFR